MSGGYDLHIHSCLSPCACDDMTPANIAGMAHVKGLSLIALTDHNCGFNLPAMSAAAEARGLVFVPGVEVNTREEAHVLAYFGDVGDAARFGEQMYASLPDIKHRPDIFGRQIVMDLDDSAARELDKLLLAATPYTLDTLVPMIRRQGGCAVPAHINRGSFSVFSNLGYLPRGLFGCVEVTKALPCPPLDAGLFVLHSSDAHRLDDIAEPVHRLDNIGSAKDFVHFVNNFKIF